MEKIDQIVQALMQKYPRKVFADRLKKKDMSIWAKESKNIAEKSIYPNTKYGSILD